MNKGITLAQLGEKVKHSRDNSQDYVMPTTKMSMRIEKTEQAKGKPPVNRPLLALFDKSSTLEFPISGLTHNQVGARLGIPGTYYDKMLREQPDLLATNVNTWFASSKDVRMTRTLDGTARAFLSDRYQRVDNWQIVAAAMPALARVPGLKIVSCEMTENRLYIQAATDKVEGKVGVGDVVQMGLVISNSEVGAGSVSVWSMLYRLRCLNGLITGDGFRKYHVGRRVEETEDGPMWSDRTKAIDDSLILSKVKDMVTHAMDEVVFRSRIDRMKDLSKMELKAKVDPTKVVGLLAKKIGASDSEQGAILNALIKGADLSAFGLLNAVTAQANTAKNYDRAVELEKAGGVLLDLSRSEWSTIMEAA